MQSHAVCVTWNRLLSNVHRLSATNGLLCREIQLSDHRKLLLSLIRALVVTIILSLNCCGLVPINFQDISHIWQDVQCNASPLYPDKIPTSGRRWADVSTKVGPTSALRRRGRFDRRANVADVGPTLGQRWANVEATLGRRWANVFPNICRPFLRLFANLLPTFYQHLIADIFV